MELVAGDLLARADAAVITRFFNAVYAWMAAGLALTALGILTPITLRANVAAFEARVGFSNPDEAARDLEVTVL